MLLLAWAGVLLLVPVLVLVLVPAVFALWTAPEEALHCVYSPGALKTSEERCDWRDRRSWYVINTFSRI